MDPLSMTASVVAVIQISSTIFDLCRTYFISARNARKDIQRLLNEINSLQDVLFTLIDLIDDPHAVSMRSAKAIGHKSGLVEQCQSDLMALAERIPIAEEQGRMHKYGWRALKWPLTSEEVDKFLATIERHKSAIGIALAVDQTMISLDMSQEMSEITQKLENQRLDGDRKAIIGWLSPPDPSVNFHAACRKCQPETGKWLISRPDFNEWVLMPNSFCWLYGIPGCGKTILTQGLLLITWTRLTCARSTIITYLNRYCAKSSNAAVAYFFFDFNDVAKQDVSHFLSSITAQLAIGSSKVPVQLMQLHNHCNYGSKQPNLTQLKEIIVSLIKGLEQVFIVVDALDECHKNEERDDLLATLLDIKSCCLPNLHVLASSRREPHIEEALLPLLTLPAIPAEGSQVNSDIRLHVRWQLANDTKLNKWPEEVKEEIEQSLVAGANGMFRWVVCQLDSLKRCLKVSLIHKTLKSLPKTLDDTYARLFLDIEDAYQEDAKIALLWLAFSERPLRVAELAEAAVLNPDAEPLFSPQERFPDPQYVVQILSSLVSVSSSEIAGQPVDWMKSCTVGPRDMVTLAHFSVKEYLMSERVRESQAKIFSVSESAAHLFITKCCILYLIQAAGDAPTDLNPFPLIKYAAKYWHVHIRQTTREDETLLSPLILELLRSYASLRSWRTHKLEVLTLRPPDNLEEFPEKDDFILDVASNIGLSVVVQSLLQEGCDPNATILGKTPLMRAVGQGHERVVKILLRYGANVNIREMSGMTALMHAVRANNFHLVEILLKEGADVGATDIDGWTSLHLAAYHGCQNIADLLLKKGASVDALMKHRGQTPLHWAAYMEYSSILELLIQHGANVNIRNTHGEGALHWAASRSYAILQQLLDNGAVPEIQTNRGETPLYWAAAEGQHKSIQALLKLGARVEVAILQAAKQEAHSVLHSLLSLSPTSAEMAHEMRAALEECDRRGYGLCSKCWDILA